MIGNTSSNMLTMNSLKAINWLLRSIKNISRKAKKRKTKNNAIIELKFIV